MVHHPLLKYLFWTLCLYESLHFGKLIHKALWDPLSIGHLGCGIEYSLDLVDVIRLKFPCLVVSVRDLFETCNFAELMMTHFNYYLL